MRRRHPLPTLWLMTDTRMGDAVWEVLEHLPRGAGIVFRHYDLAEGERRTLLTAMMAVARRRRLTLVGAGGLETAHGSHNRKPQRGLYTRSAHDRREIVAAARAGVDLVFISPVFDTRSHPGARPLGNARFGLMIRGVRIPVIALGGMDARRARSLARLGIYGWAGIDAWTVSSGHGAK